MEELASGFQNKVSIHSKPNFSDLPLELIEKIVKEADLPCRLALRKVSVYLRALVDKQTPKYKHIGIVINSNCIQLDLEGILINYTSTENRNCTIEVPGKKPKKMYKDNIYVMFDDLMTFMSKPSFYVEHLKITTTDDASYEMFTYLQRKFLRSKIEVNSLWIKVNMDQELRKVSDFIDRSKVQKSECHWLEEESRWNLRECMELVVREGDNFVGEESYVISRKDDLPWMKKYGKKKKEYEESLQPSEVVKWDVHVPKELYI
ncbi:hypothetical protein CAEBREN_15733 [Caenorhabditis brenneri]|uniref:F-box domain-containing protein n=1 Tax=Caenorhabditis brenneri TaxID=135651 RepID=G0MFT9_CAEBE|nr:hypothetical protein CAEBREN_15733 [Caenorhabditis brenneri]